MSNEVAIIDEKSLENKIYFVRNQKVMLDFELAEIYGYTTKRFNEQVKNNIDKFDDDFMFQLTENEFKNLRSKKSTSKRGGTRYLPYAFTEQGVYMLMTVLKGDLATKQSKALIRTFKKMKDYIIENQNLIGKREYFQLSMEVAESLFKTKELRMDLLDVENQMASVIDSLSDIVSRSELSMVMNTFGQPKEKRSYLMMNGQPFLGDLVFNEIYCKAIHSLYIVDNYIGIRTLEKLINVKDGVKIIIFSDNLYKGLTKNIFDDFCKEYPSLDIQLFNSGGVFHDRYIIMDYGLDTEKIYLCGSSSKDAGNRISTIIEDFDRDKYKIMIQNLLLNQQLVL